MTNTNNPPRTIQALMACGLVRNMIGDAFRASRVETTRERRAREQSASARAPRVSLLAARAVA